MKPVIDLSGGRVGRLLVIHRSGTHVTPNGCSQPLWLCQCDCGAAVTVRGQSLRLGLTRSCGCLNRDTTIARNAKHGHSLRGAESREYQTWKSMKGRCLSPRNADYADYGGRGITVCDRWANNFPLFLSDMGPCPPKHTLERIDNDGPYAPDNCRWATRREQRRNQRGRTTWVEAFGERLSLTDAAVKYGINRDRLRYRIESGWPHERAVTA
jgi:hypothetical protein